MLKKVIIPLLVLSLFTNIIFILKNNSLYDSSEVNFIGYYETDGSLNFNIKKENEIIVDDGNNYINTELTKINKNTLSFNINNSNNLIFWNGINYIVYITSKDYAITLYKKSEKNIYNTNLKLNDSFSL